MNLTVHVVGGGLAGSEAAWQLLQKGCKVVMHEMRPTIQTPAHETHNLAELVCSNSLKSKDIDSVPGSLKYEMQTLNSLIISAAYQSEVAAGGALAVEREKFSQIITQTLLNHSNFSLLREEVCFLPNQAELEKNNECYIVATGPLTSKKMTIALQELTEDGNGLYFYDAIAPILASDSIDLESGFMGNRWDDLSEIGDYLNIPLNKDQYYEFVADIEQAEKMPLHDFESAKYFECCLPIEVMVERGKDTLRFGPMKPIGLKDPKTGLRPYANIQLRKENNEATMFSMVGFQTKMKWPEQKRVFSKLPGLAQAEFLRFGSVHRNTYLESPKFLSSDLSFKKNNRIFLAGQITGVEGYTESAAIGLLAGRFAADRVGGKKSILPPRECILGALLDYVTFGNLGRYEPMNANLGLLPKVSIQGKKLPKHERKKFQCQTARTNFDTYVKEIL